MVEYITIAVFFAAGIYMSGRVYPAFSVIFFLSLILVLTVQAFFKHKFNLKITLLVFAFVIGTVLGYCSQSTGGLELSDYLGKYVTVTGRVCDMPDTDGENIRYMIKTDSITYRDNIITEEETILLTAPSAFEYGDSVTFSGFLKLLPEKMNENGFDIARYYKGKGIFFKIYSPDVREADYKIHAFSPRDISLYARRLVMQAIDTRYKGDYAAVLKDVLTGDESYFSEEFQAVLDRTGLERFYYPAFLRVMLFMSAITLALGFAGKKKRDIVTVFLLIIYALFNIGDNVAIKICIMLALFIIFRLIRGHVYYPDIIGITGIILGVINPLIYYDIGFIMSMLSGILIYYFYDSVEGLVKFIKPKYVRRLLVIGIICNIGLAPVAAYFFNCVTVYSVFVSFIMLPCVAIILILSPLTVSMLAVFHTAPVVGWVTSAMVFVLKNIPLLADRVTFFGGNVGKTSVLELLIYLFLIIALVKLVKKKKRHMYMALFTAAALCVSLGISEMARLDNVELTFVNVGQGDGAVISAPHRFNILIDGGGGNAYSDYNPGEKLYLEYLKAEGINKVDSAFVSHYHKDHVQGIIAAIENLRVRNVFMPDNMEGSEWRVKIEEAANARGTKIHYITDETLLTYNNGMTIQIIPPAKKTALSDDENDTTFVYYVKYGEFSAMFTGDMSRFAEKCLLESGKVPRAELLKVAHHGSKSATSAEWADTVDPRYSVISVGENNTYYLPDDETLETLSSSLVYRTDYDGDIKISADKSGVRGIETFNRRD